MILFFSMVGAFSVLAANGPTLTPEQIQKKLYPLHFIPNTRGVAIVPEYTAYDQKSIQLTKSITAFERHYSQAVFKTNSSDNSGSGTSFLVGKNLVLTNRHVFIPKSDTDWSCGDFYIEAKILNIPTRVHCKKVHYCSPAPAHTEKVEQDFCLVELKRTEFGFHVGDRIAPLELNPNPQYGGGVISILIGNHLDQGIQADWNNRTLTTAREGELLHYSVGHHGSSGSPILDLNGKVIGIHFGSRGGNYGFRHANTSDYILKVLMAKLTPETNNKIAPASSP